MKQQKTNLEKFIFLNDNILVDPMKTESVSGLTMVHDREDKAEFGIVLKIGEGRLLDNGIFVKPDINIGDYIFYGKWTPAEIRVDGKDYLIVKMEDVIAVKR